MLGESHGIAETANAILALVRRLDVRALALEWSHDEVDDIVQAVFDTGRIDLDALWETPPGGDLFASDGRFTAGHVAVIQQLVGEGRLEQLILVDRLESDGPERELEMATRLVGSLRHDRGAVAIVGTAHALRGTTGRPESMFGHLEPTRPGVANGRLSFSSGRCHHRGESELCPVGDAADAIFELGVATPAVVPAK